MVMDIIKLAPIGGRLKRKLQSEDTQVEDEGDALSSIGWLIKIIITLVAIVKPTISCYYRSLWD